MNTEQGLPKVFSDKILVRPIERPTETSGGIILIQTDGHDEPHEGIVVSGGMQGFSPRVLEDLKVGDSVFYSRWAGRSITWKGEELRVMTKDDVLAYWSPTVPEDGYLG